MKITGYLASQISLQSGAEQGAVCHCQGAREKTKF